MRGRDAGEETIWGKKDPENENIARKTKESSARKRKTQYV